MRKVVLFIAVSLDGYIADKQGGVDWLTGQEPEAETADSYAEFEKTIDTVVMGWRTYEQIVTELSPDQWVYENLHSYVITHRDCPSSEAVTFTATEPCALVEQLKKREGKAIWVCGGAGIARQLMRRDLIDVYHISVIPTLLGDGIRLFDRLERERKLRLTSMGSSNGIVEMIYEKREG